MDDIFKKTIVTIMTFLAKLVLRRYKPKIIGVTGSVGKTSTKDAIYTALTPFFHIRKSEKSFNSDTGVPLSILGVPNAWKDPWGWTKNIGSGILLVVMKHVYPKWLVLEIGADRPGDIRNLAKWIKPHVVVITRFPDVPAHIEFFPSKEAVIEEKTSLALALRPGGLLVLNADDNMVHALGEKIQARIVTYGFKVGAMMRAVNFRREYEIVDGISMPRGISFEAVYDEQTVLVRMPQIIGETHVYAALAALAVAWKEGGDVARAAEAMADYTPPPGRLSLIEGGGGTTIIDDTYNSSPTACEAAIHVLDDMTSTGKKIAVLGDMLELGKMTDDSHKQIGKLVAKKCDLLITVGARAKLIFDAAYENGLLKKRMVHFNDSTAAGEYLKTVVEKGDLILVKGSQGVRLERAVEALMAHPEDREKLLVRQDAEWLKR